MLKRITNATSLLVAAAAIVSIVPAHAADYKKIDSQEGTVYNAFAYKDGKFYIDGEVNNQDDAAYYLANGKFNAISDFDSGSSVDTYGSKYLNVENGDYFVNLDNGSVTDDSVKSNAEDDASTALRKTLKKDNDGRYSTSEVGTIQTLTELEGNKFSEAWYKVQYTKVDAATNGSATKLNVYTDANGNYIDADYNLGSIKVTTIGGGVDADLTTTGDNTTKTVTVNNTDDTYDGASATSDGKASKITANVTGIQEIGQDANYIYRIATVNIQTDANVKVSQINGKSTADTSVFGSSGNTFQVIQKISKAQASDKIDGAKYAKSVSTYVVSKDAGTASTGLLSSNKYTVSNGKIINYAVTGNSVDTQTIVLSSKNGYNYTDISDKSTEHEVVIDKDANGNLWRLDAGYIYKWDNNEDWTKVYKVDGSFDKMSVYDENDIVAWNQDDEVYSVIGGQAATTTPAPVETTPVVNKGWVKTNAGWTFYNATGAQVKGQWVNDGGVWYYIKADGVMATGWVKDGANWYFLNGSGAMKTGWLNDNGTWYFLQASGAMKTGWLNDNGTWYYLNASGAMLANTTVDGYKLGASGAWVK
jgi:hypothetical protein